MTHLTGIRQTPVTSVALDLNSHWRKPGGVLQRPGELLPEYSNRSRVKIMPKEFQQRPIKIFTIMLKYSFHLLLAGTNNFLKVFFSYLLWVQKLFSLNCFSTNLPSFFSFFLAEHSSVLS